MNENKTAYITLMFGIIVSFVFFMSGLALAGSGYGKPLVEMGALVLTLTPPIMIFNLMINYFSNRDRKWSILCALILVIMLFSALTTYLFK